VRIVVVGGGLAGITAALDCADSGAQVTLLEVRPRLGGAAYSFERDGLLVDNGQHVFLRCCHAYRALLARLGSERHVHLQPRLEIPVVTPGAGVTLLRRSAWLPAPLHLAGALLRYRHLSVRERLRAALAARALGRLDPADPVLDWRTLGGWLEQHGQNPRSVAALWDLIALPTLNLPAAQASLALGAFVFRTGLLASAGAGDIGFHTRPLSEILGEPAAAALGCAGIDVRLGCRVVAVRAGVAGLEVHARGADAAPEKPEDDARGADAAPEKPEDDAGRRGREAADSGGMDNGRQEELRADAVVVAVPHQRAGVLLDGLLPDVAADLRSLQSSPIVNLHVVYDRPVCELDFAAGVGTPVQYVFDRSEAAGLQRGRYLAVSLSGAERDMQRSQDALRERYLPALAELFPRTRTARVERFLVTREHAATFRAAPGVGAIRPVTRTAVPGLVLAGAYTATGWPATLEGAVRSGHAAARAALDDSTSELMAA
jgi:uncharacterized protein with NAD-binding domain and iron-sulfur cluster